MNHSVTNLPLKITNTNTTHFHSFKPQITVFCNLWTVKLAIKNPRIHANAIHSIKTIIFNLLPKLLLQHKLVPYISIWVLRTLTLQAIFVLLRCQLGSLEAYWKLDLVLGKESTKMWTFELCSWGCQTNKKGHSFLSFCFPGNHKKSFLIVLFFFFLLTKQPLRSGIPGFGPCVSVCLYNFLVKFKATSRLIEIPKVELEKEAERAGHGRRKRHGKKERNKWRSCFADSG